MPLAPRVVWVDADESLEEACRRQGIEYSKPALIDTGVGEIFFVGWQKQETTK